MFERFSDDARRVVTLAHEDARLLQHPHIGTEHVLLALAREREGEGIVADTWRALDVTERDVLAKVEELVGRGDHAPEGDIPFTPDAKKALELALREALRLDDAEIRAEHLLLGLLREPGCTGCRVLEAMEITPAAVAQQVMGLVAGAKIRARARPIPPRGARGMLQTWGRPTDRPSGRCSLCGRDEARCEHMLVAGGVRLCSECARAAVAQLDALPADAPKLVRYRRADVAIADKDAAVAAIERAFDAVMSPMQVAVDDALAYVEGGEDSRQLLQDLREGGQNAPMVATDQTVERVRFLDDAEAEVSLGIWLAGSSQPMLQPAHAVLEGGAWKVSRSTLQHFVQMTAPFRRRPPQD